MTYSQGDYFRDTNVSHITAQELGSPHSQMLWEFITSGEAVACFIDDDNTYGELKKHVGGLAYHYKPADDRYLVRYVTFEPDRLLALVKRTSTDHEYQHVLNVNAALWEDRRRYINRYEACREALQGVK